MVWGKAQPVLRTDLPSERRLPVHQQVNLVAKLATSKAGHVAVPRPRQLQFLTEFGVAKVKAQPALHLGRRQPGLPRVRQADNPVAHLHRPRPFLTDSVKVRVKPRPDPKMDHLQVRRQQAAQRGHKADLKMDNQAVKAVGHRHLHLPS